MSDAVNLLPALASLVLAGLIVTGRGSPWLRVPLLAVALLTSLEFGARCGSLHRTLLYERQGDLLFTPRPNQQYVEKISLTPSRTNEYGLRGNPLPSSSREIILCLGDSITYGYGLDDASTYPAQLQGALEARRPGRFAVLNGGVNAYPITFIHQKFLYLWRLGLHPATVIVGYSMNEGWLGHLVESDEETKRSFEQRVRLKNHVRSLALYNLVVENWARAYYDAIKTRLVPGTHSTAEPVADEGARYEHALQRLLEDLQARGVRPVFLLFGTLNGQTGRFESSGPFQARFAAFAETRGIPLLRSDEAFRKGRPADSDISGYFLDPGHMNPSGTALLAERIADLLLQIPNAGQTGDAGR